MTHTEARAVLTTITARYPGVELTASNEAAFVEAIRSYGLDVAMTAAAELSNGAETFPSVAAFHSAAQRVRARFASDAEAAHQAVRDGVDFRAVGIEGCRRAREALRSAAA